MILPGNIKDQFFDLRGLSVYSCMSVSALRLYIKRPKGSLPCFKVKGKILVKRPEFDAWMERYRMNQAQDLKAIAQEALDKIKG
jgi:hypothetical protein